MPVWRTIVAVVLAVTWTEASLQQPPRDGRPLRQTAVALLTQGHDSYKAKNWQKAIDRYEAALAADRATFTAYFFLANSYDNLYDASRATNRPDRRHLLKAVEHYRNAAARETDPDVQKRAAEYLAAAYGPDKLNDPAEAQAIHRDMDVKAR